LNLVRKMCSSDCVRILRINSASASRRMTRGSQWFGYQLPKASCEEDKRASLARCGQAC
jgi:hypothetical protein